MSSLVSVTWPSLTMISRPPSPSTRARAGTLMCRLPCVMLARLLVCGRAEWLGRGVKSAERTSQGWATRAEVLPDLGHRRGVRRFHRAEAAVAAAIDARAERAAASLRHWPQARRAVRHHHADPPGAFALDAHGVPADIRPAPGEESGDHLE